MKFQLSSTAFRPNENIPQQFTCDGADVSPALEWDQAPDKAASFTLICDDPDAPAGTWVHWVLFDLPGETRSLPQGVPPDKELASGARQGLNDFRKIGYGGPCPPPGPPHRYFFRLYALDKKLGLPAGSRRNEVERALKGHVMAEAELVGRYQRAARK